MTDHSEDYLLGTTDEELGRLGYQHNVWHPEAEKLWELAGFKAGQSLLDLGCGPGFATLDLSQIVGAAGNVHAVDAAGNFVEYLGQKLADSNVTNVSLEQADVADLGLDDSSVDGVFARWLFCFLPEPGAALREVFRVMRPGSSLVIWDYFNYLSARFFPNRDSIKNLFSAFELSNNRRGGTYQIGGRLPSMLISQGFELSALEPMCKAIRPGTPMWQWFVLFKDGFAPALVDEGLLSAAEFEQIQKDIDELAANPDTFFFPPPQIGIVARKPA